MKRVALCLTIVVSLTVVFSGVLALQGDTIENTIKLYDSRSHFPLQDCKKPEVNGDGIHFKLYTRERFSQNLTLEDIKEHGFPSFYPVKKATKILVHGWHGWGSMKTFQRMVYDYLYTQDVNVISMDWSVYSRKCNLKSTSQVVTTVSGETLADLLQVLVSNGSDAAKFHIIGFGVGSHIAGVAAKVLNSKVGRITALEPMGLLFDSPGYPKLETSDAQVVVVIYTTEHHSSSRDVGHIVFFVEGGRHPQPGCTGKDEMCSAYRSISYFRRSIVTPYAFPAKKINAITGPRPQREGSGSTYTPDNYMGEYVDPSKLGKYYVNLMSHLPVLPPSDGADVDSHVWM